MPENQFSGSRVVFELPYILIFCRKIKAKKRNSLIQQVAAPKNIVRSAREITVDFARSVRFFFSGCLPEIACATRQRCGESAVGPGESGMCVVLGCFEYVFAAHMKSNEQS